MTSWTPINKPSGVIYEESARANRDLLVLHSTFEGFHLALIPVDNQCRYFDQE